MPAADDQRAGESDAPDHHALLQQLADAVAERDFIDVNRALCRRDDSVTSPSRMPRSSEPSSRPMLSVAVRYWLACRTSRPRMRFLRPAGFDDGEARPNENQKGHDQADQHLQQRRENRPEPSQPRHLIDRSASRAADCRGRPMCRPSAADT